MRRKSYGRISRETIISSHHSEFAYRQADAQTDAYREIFIKLTAYTQSVQIYNHILATQLS